MTKPTMFSLALVAPPPWSRAMVSAGTGFLGSHLCERLLDAGVEVDCVASPATGSPRDVGHLADSPGFRFLERDLTRPDCPASLTGPYDLVLHVTCPTAVPHPSQDPDLADVRNALA